MPGWSYMGQAADGSQGGRLNSRSRGRWASDTTAGQDSRTRCGDNEASVLAGMARAHGVMAGRLAGVMWRTGRILYETESGGLRWLRAGAAKNGKSTRLGAGLRRAVAS